MEDMLGKLVTLIVAIPKEMLGSLFDLAEKLSGEAGQEWWKKLKKFLRKEQCWINKSIVRLISDEEEIDINGKKFEVYELTEGGNFDDIFGSFDQLLDDLCMSDDEIEAFKKDHRKWIKDDRWIFFLHKKGNNYFVAYVRFNSGGGLRVRVNRFEYSYVWNAKNYHRVVVPRLA